MSEDSSKQAVADTGGDQADKPESAPTGAQGDAYQEALDSFKPDEPKADPKPDGAGDGKPEGDKPAVDPDQLANDVVQRVEAKIEVNADVKALVGKLTEGTGASPKMGEAYLDNLWRTDTEVRNAFLGRRENPKAWSAVEGGLAKRFGTEIGQSGEDKAATADRNAVTSAVHSASKVPPGDEVTDKSIWGQSTADFEKSMRTLGART